MKLLTKYIVYTFFNNIIEGGFMKKLLNMASAECDIIEKAFVKNKMKYNNTTKTILTVLISVFIFSFIFISCGEKEHICPVCPPDDYSGYFEFNKDAPAIYPFLNPDYVWIYEVGDYDLNDTTKEPKIEVWREDSVVIIYSPDDTSRISYHSRGNFRAIFYLSDSGLYMLGLGTLWLIGNTFPLMFPQSKYFVGKKWEDSASSYSVKPYREIISMDEVVTTVAGTFENCIKIKEWGFSDEDTSPYVLYYVRNDIGIIKAEYYRYTFSQHRIEQYKVLIDKNF